MINQHAKQLEAVHRFMLEDAPILVEASDLSLQIVKKVARVLYISHKEKPERVKNFLIAKYGTIYDPTVLGFIAKEALGDAKIERSQAQTNRKAKAAAPELAQPLFLM